MRRAARLLFATVLGAGLAPAGARAQAPAPDPHVQAPVRRKHVDPEYPKALFDSGRDVEVVLTLTIDGEGKVERAEVAVSGGAEFDQAALDAVKQWDFEPATRDGKPVHSKIRVPFHFAPPKDAHRATSTVPSQATEEEAHKAPPPRPAPPPDAETVTIQGRSPLPSRGAGDSDVAVGALAAVPRQDAASLLRLAPGVVLQNEGGEGHPHQIFLRGFDAGEGQDVEMSVDGIPINEPGNVHGAGLSDTHFIIPELVRRLRVLEGPFAPQQGNFGVAGSALFDLGLEQTGVTAKLTGGSFGTRRLLLAWRPEGCSERTFAAGELFASDGFGQNRASQRASAMGGWEGRIGESLVWRLLVTSYATQYRQAGVVREDDVASGKVGFFGTYDPSQGGESARHSIGLTLHDKLGAVRLRQSVFGIVRDFRVRDDNTGFREDARGDLVDQQTRSATVGARGSARTGASAFGQRQELEVGYFARYDAVGGVQERDRFGTTVPYAREIDLSSGITNVALYADASLKPRSWITLRGGGRGDLFHTRATDALTTQTGSTVVTAWQPRATLLLGPARGVTLSGSVGQAVRTFAPQDVFAGGAPPLGTATSWEAGAAYDRPLGATELSARSVFFGTSLDHDVLFDERTGRNALANGNTRAGWAGSARATGRFFDVSGSVTFARATDDVTHAEVPYVPPVALRADAAVFGDLPWPRIGGRRLEGTLGVGAIYVGRRPLPGGASAADYFLLDASARLAWRRLELGLTGTNLLDQRWSAATFRYASDFGTQPGVSTPVRHFAPGAPLAVMATLGATL